MTFTVTTSSEYYAKSGPEVTKLEELGFTFRPCALDSREVAVEPGFVKVEFESLSHLLSWTEYFGGRIILSTNPPSIEILNED